MDCGAAINVCIYKPEQCIMKYSVYCACVLIHPLIISFCEVAVIRRSGRFIWTDNTPLHRVCGPQVLKCCFCGNFFPWILGRVEQVTKTLGLICCDSRKGPDLLVPNSLWDELRMWHCCDCLMQLGIDITDWCGKWMKMGVANACKCFR